MVAYISNDTKMVNIFNDVPITITDTTIATVVAIGKQTVTTARSSHV